MRELAQLETMEAQAHDLGDLVLAPPASLRLNVVRADGSPWRGPMPYVRLADAKGTRLFRRNEPVPGGVRLQLWPGQYTVHIDGTDLIAAPQQVALPAGAETEVRRYWYLNQAFAFGRYEVEAHSVSGLRYRGALDVRDDMDDATRVDVPRVAQ